MTVRQLIQELSKVDDDVMNYEVWFTFRKSLGPDVKITGRARLEAVPENVDVDTKRIYLKTVTIQ
jgi:hypothetical protein